MRSPFKSQRKTISETSGTTDALRSGAKAADGYNPRFEMLQDQFIRQFQDSTLLQVPVSEDAVLFEQVQRPKSTAGNASTQRLSRRTGSDHRQPAAHEMDAAAMVTGGAQFPSLAERTMAYSNVQCPHCFRKFSEKAALRHIPVCPQINKQSQMTPVPVPSKAMDLKRPATRQQRSPQGRTPLQPKRPEHNFSNVSSVREEAAEKPHVVQTLQQLREARRSFRNQEWMD